MGCTEIREELTALADGALPAAEAAAVEAHLRNCGACAAELAELESTVTLSHAALSEDLPVLRPGFDTRMRAQLAEIDAGRKRRRWWRPLFVGAMASIAVLVMARSVGGPSAVLVPLGIQKPPKKVAEKPMLYKDYEIIEHLDELENFETVIQTPLEEDLLGDDKGSG